MLLLCLLCLLLYAPGLATIPPVDRDEARFAQATKQMLETGDFVRIRFQDEARNKKPIGIYWLQAASVVLFSTADSTAIWPYRVPSALAAAIAVLLTWRLGTSLSGPDTGFAGAVLLACCLGLVAEAHLAKTDAALLAAAVAGQGLLGFVYVRRRAGAPVPAGVAYGFWAAEAVAILLKGPPVPMVALVTAAALSVADRDWRWLAQMRPVGGVVLAALLVAPWLVAIETATGGKFLGQAVGHDLLPKLVGAQEAHGAPPGYYLALSLVTFWPGSLLLVPALVGGWRRRGEPAVRFLLAWLLPAWVMFELVPTKLPHYVLPLYPALALLAGRALSEGAALAGRARFANIAVIILWGLVTVGLAGLLVISPAKFGVHRPPGMLIGAFWVVLTAITHFARPRLLNFAVMAVVWVIAAAVLLPRLDQLWPSRAAVTLVREHQLAAGRPVVAVGDSEPSLVFLLGTKTRLLAAAPAAAAIADGGLALVADREDAAFRAALATHGRRPQALGRVGGLDYSNGRHLTLTLYDAAPD